MAGVTYSQGQEDLRAYLMNGSGSVTQYKALMKALCGDIVLKCTPATKSKSATTQAWTETVDVTLETADGEVHTWYSGPVTLAIADTSTAGTATISPTAGAKYMTDGKLTVTVSGNAAAWIAAETVTLTASIADQDSSGDTDKNILGYAVADKTAVFTFA